MFQDELLNNTFSVNEASENTAHAKRVAEMSKHFQSVYKIKKRVQAAYEKNEVKLKYSVLITKLEKIKTKLLSDK